MAAIQRGAGRSIVPMFVMMLVWCGVRVTYISIVIRIIPVINVIYWAYLVYQFGDIFDSVS
jgi:Na+-driven multidrug efflux pump